MSFTVKSKIYPGRIKMKILISPISVEEVKIVAQSAADIIDIKNVNEGSLGAQFPLVTKEMVEVIRPFKKECSATLGDLPYKPGTAALAALGLVRCGVDYIKAGLYGPKNFSEAFDMIIAIVQTVRAFSDHIKVVAAGYADWRKFNGLSPYDLVAAAKEAAADVVLIDTAVKDGSTLFEAMAYQEIQQFVEQAKSCHLEVALAGSLKESHLPRLAEIAPDIIGVRGAVCAKGNRKAGITEEALSSFLAVAKKVTNRVLS